MPTRLMLNAGARIAVIGSLLASLARKIIGKKSGQKSSASTIKAIIPKWVRSKSIYIGHEPTFDIRCKRCDEEMFLRYTAVGLERVIMRAGHKASNELAYKCPDCGQVDRFIVPDSRLYIKKMLRARRGIELYYPPIGVWRKISDKIRLQLQSLGYVGGMETDAKPETPILRPGS